MLLLILVPGDARQGAERRRIKGALGESQVLLTYIATSAWHDLWEDNGFDVHVHRIIVLLSTGGQPHHQPMDSVSAVPRFLWNLSLGHMAGAQTRPTRPHMTPQTTPLGMGNSQKPRTR